MPRLIKNTPLRLFIYLVLLCVFISFSVYVFIRVRRKILRHFPAKVERRVPVEEVSRPAWIVTPQATSDANEDFSVEHAKEGNQPMAGRGIGAAWPQFNGPNRTNRSEEIGLLESWPDDGPPLLWAARGMGEGFSAVSVVDGIVYTMGNKKDFEAVIAVDAGTGEKIWSTPIGRSSKIRDGNGPRSTPTYNDGFVYALGGEGELACLDSLNGDVKWQMNILAKYRAENLTWGICESVLIDDEKLICTPGGYDATIIALNKRNGQEIWTTLDPDEGASYASSLVADIQGVRQYVQFLSKSTAGFRADDGKFLWKNSRSSSGINCSSPLVEGDHVFSASNYGCGGALLKLKSKNQMTTADLIYHTVNMKNHHGDMVIVNGFLFGSNDPGILMCLNLLTGKVKWQNRSVGKGSVTYADGKIILRSETNEIALIAATGDKYRELGRFEPPDRSASNSFSHPVVAHGRLFLRDQDLLLCYDLKGTSTNPE